MQTPAPVRVVLIGVGGIGDYHVRQWQKIPGAELVGIYDMSAKIARTVADKYGVKQVFESLEAALAEPNLDAVDVCTPNHAHAPTVVAALDAGKHCICEKPLAATAAEIEQMIEARDRSGKLLMTAQHLRFEHPALALKKLIDAGDLGDIYYGRAWWLRRRMAPTSPGLMAKAQGIHGPGLDIGVHVLDLAMHFMGHPEPVSVSGHSVRQLAHQPDIGNQWGTYQPADYEVEDLATAFIRFAGGAVLSLEASWLLNMREPEVRAVHLFGTRGGACWPDMTVNQVRHGLLLDTQVASHDDVPGHRTELAAFADAVRTGGPSPVPAEQSLRVARILEALYASADAGREIRL
ncbi:MAG: Gfo/Idh/MocA family oxidoreductase [Phycisphaerae bacterium]|jgi:predicted dehydrogenase